MRRVASVSCGSFFTLLLNPPNITSSNYNYNYSPRISHKFFASSSLLLLISSFPSQSTPGHSSEDALRAADPFKAVEDALKEKDKKQQEKDDNNKEENNNNNNKENNKEENPLILPEDIDPIASSINKRRRRRKQSVDTILGDVLHDALRLRDLGQKPDTDFIYKRTQERIYEAEHGRRPNDGVKKFLPFPPDLKLHRLISISNIKLIEEDPWPARAITLNNPVWTRQQVEEDKIKTGGAHLKEYEKKMFAPREGFDPIGEFMDAIDELAYWEEIFIKYIREAPLPQRRTLPLLHEMYRYIAHRLDRAERRYITTRDIALAKCKASPAVYKMTELNIDRIRALYSETHKSLSSPNYDPTRMKKSITGPLLQMSEAEFEEWRNVRKHQRNRLVAEIV